jgi:hypothetical protein
MLPRNHGIDLGEERVRFVDRLARLRQRPAQAITMVP